MAGKGERFRSQGFEKDKWRLNIGERTMFEWSMLSLKQFFEEDFVFIAREEQDAEKFVRSKCRQLGIGNLDFVEIEEETDGQATTALKAHKLIDDKDEVAIYNIDTYIEGGIEKELILGDGHIPVFTAEEDKWSFVRTGPRGEATEITEKEPISDLATIGFYYFKNFGTLREAWEKEGDRIKEKYGEKYVAPLYNYLIDQEKEVTVQKIRRENVHVLGTPTDIREFRPGFDRNDE